MKEIEGKILDIDLCTVTNHLQKLGAEKIFDGEINSLYFDWEDRKLRKADKTLRLRQKGNHSFITFKSRCDCTDVKIEDEFETECGNFQEARNILRSLGLIEYSSDKRKRVSYKLGQNSVEINIYEQIPPFLEIEAKNNAELKETAHLLGFENSAIKNWSGKQVLEHYGK